MKKITLLLFLAFSLNAFSQEMSFENGQVYFDGIRITPKLAKQKSQSVSTDAYASFKKAGNIRGWNVFLGIFGGYEVVAGGINLANGYNIGAVEMASGAVCIGIIPTREAKRRMWMNDGVNKYNSAIKN